MKSKNQTFYNSVSLLLLLIFTMLLTGCNAKKISGTNLTDIRIWDIALGQTLNDMDTSVFTPDDRFTSSENQYPYEQLHIHTDTEGNIVYLFSYFIDYSDEISIRDNTSYTSITQITEALGNNYIEKWYDKEQYLMEHIYYDHENNTAASFVYDKHSEDLVWILYQNLE